MLRLGLDLGGTKIAASLLDREGREVWAHRVATPRHDYDATLDAIADLVALAEREAGGAITVGVGMPGAITPGTGAVKNANSIWLNARPFQDDLIRRLGRAVRVANDANCLAVSESADGAAAGAAVVFAAILGTGTGGGIVVNGHLVTGANAIGGEWGHNPLPWPEDDERPGPACYCGHTGCIETFLSGPGLAADYARRTGTTCASEDVFRRSADGEAPAVATIDAWFTRVAKSFASIINVLDPDVIVVGGGLSRIAALYDEVPRRWGRWVFSNDVVTRLVPAKHGDASGVRGAAWLWGLEDL